LKRLRSLLWPLLAGMVSLAVTGWLWDHERHTQERHLKDNFEFGLRQEGLPKLPEERRREREAVWSGVGLGRHCRVCAHVPI